jgi:hypothetical protein
MMPLENPIERSFELAAPRCEDLTPLVYDRLFNEHPEARSMFRTEGSEIVKGSMLALTIESILDFAGERSGHFRLIECEVSSHDAYGTPRELFIAFFGNHRRHAARNPGNGLVAGDRASVAEGARRDQGHCDQQRELIRAPPTWNQAGHRITKSFFLPTIQGLFTGTRFTHH